MECFLPGCSRRAIRRGLCEAHYEVREELGLEKYERQPGGPCKVDGCDRPRHGRDGYCEMHRKRLARTGDPLRTRMATPGTWVGKVCAVAECSRSAQTKGFCSLHAKRIARHGDPTVTLRRANGTRSPAQNKRQHDDARRRYRNTEHGKRAERLRRQVRHALGKDAPNEVRLALKAMLEATHCPACGREYKPTSECSFSRKTVDHIRPIRHGGTNELSNLRVICQSCNSRKQATWPQRE